LALQYPNQNMKKKLNFFWKTRAKISSLHRNNTCNQKVVTLLQKLMKNSKQYFQANTTKRQHFSLYNIKNKSMKQGINTSNVIYIPMMFKEISM